MDEVQAFAGALLSLDRAGARSVLEGCAGGDDPAEVLASIVVPALDLVGAGWDDGSVALSQVYMSGRICEELVDVLLPAASPERVRKPTTAIATLEDYHLLGKRIVYSVLRASGRELIDYGRVDVEGLVQRVDEDGIRLLLLSVLMCPSALRIQTVRAALPDHVKIIVGGAPFRFDDQLWRQVGADAAGRTASDAVSLVARFASEDS